MKKKRGTFAGGLDMMRFGSANYPKCLDISINASENIIITFNGNSKDFTVGFTTGAWYIVTVVYNGAGNFSGSNLYLHVYGLAKTEITNSGGSIGSNALMSTEVIRLHITAGFTLITPR